jgi:hypothetical protein
LPSGDSAAAMVSELVISGILSLSREKKGRAGRC